MVGVQNLSPLRREIHPKSSELFRDNYLFDFLNLPKPHDEQDLRKDILNNLKSFISEFG